MCRLYQREIGPHRSEEPGYGASLVRPTSVRCADMAPAAGCICVTGAPARPRFTCQPVGLLTVKVSLSEEFAVAFATQAWEYFSHGCQIHSPIAVM